MFHIRCKCLQGETCPQIFDLMPSPKFPFQLAVECGQYWCPWLGWWIWQCIASSLRKHSQTYMFIRFQVYLSWCLKNMQSTRCMSQSLVPRLHKHVNMHAIIVSWLHVLSPTACHGLMHACMWQPVMAWGFAHVGTFMPQPAWLDFVQHVLATLHNSEAHASQ